MPSGPTPMGALGRQVAARIRELREARGMSRRDLARRLAEHGCGHIGVTGVAKLETAERLLKIDEFGALYMALNVTPMHLLVGAGPQARVCDHCKGEPARGFQCLRCGAQ